MTDFQIIALVARATDIIIRALAPASACAPREEWIQLQLAAVAEAAAPPPEPPPMPDAEREAHLASAARQFEMLGRPLKPLVPQHFDNGQQESGHAPTPAQE